MPEKFRIYHDRCELAPGSVAHGWRLSDLPDRLAKFTTTRGIAWVDLTPPLRTAAASGPLLYFDDDGHWSGAAHALVAEILARDASTRLGGSGGR